MKRRHLKIAITCPRYLPYGRRGSERYVFDLCNFFYSRGHEVTIITSKPGKSRIQRRGNTTIISNRYLQHPLLLRHPRLVFHTFALSCFTSLLTGKYDIVHSLLYPDGYALSINRIIKRTKYVFQVTNSPNSIIGDMSIARWMLHGAVCRADQLLSSSQYIKSLVKEELGYESEVIPVPVNCSFFRPISTKDMNHPRILYAGSLNDPRKRVDLLIEAFNILIEKNPKAILQLSGEVNAEVKSRLLSRAHTNALDSVYFLGAGRFTDMPKLYSEACVTVLPSIDEAQGMVLNESLACGTPVVGTNSAGIPEIINDLDVGTLFESSDTSLEVSARALCEAIHRTIDLSKDPQTVQRCREHAMRFSWEVIGPQIEQLYYKVLNKK